jgi:PAS domain S-box-containing protein
MLHLAPTNGASLSFEEAESILRQLAGTASWDRPDLSLLNATLAGIENNNPPRQATAPPERAQPVPRRWSESTLKSLLEAAPDALVLFDSEGTLTFANARTEQLFGYRRAEILGLNIEQIVPELLRDPHLQHSGSLLAPTAASPTAAALELYGRRKDGRDFPIEISLSHLETEEGPLISCTIRDITNRRRLEARYRNLVEGIPAVTFMAALDEGDNELYVSPQIEELLGFSQKEWLEDPVLWYTRLHPEDRDRWHLEFANTCASAAPFKSVYRFVARNGRVVWVQGEAKVVRDVTGRPLFLQGVAFDITERKNAEEALREAHDHLDSLVQQRTAELANTNQELESALKEKDSLLKEIHHRVKNNLQVISSLLNLQSASIKDPQTLQAIRESQNRVKSMALIHDRLYKSRDLARIDIGAYIRDLIADLFRSYGIATSHIRLRLMIEDAWLSLDAAIPCGLIVTELVSNCLKHAFPDHRAGQITIALDSAGAGTWILAVQDNGVGLPEGFDPFQTESLGLQLVETLADQLGGSAKVESGHGTRFEVQFTDILAK